MTELKICRECERRIRPWNRKRTEPGFENTVAKGVGDRCAACYEAWNTGKLHQQYKEIDAAVEMYWAHRGVSA